MFLAEVCGSLIRALHDHEPSTARHSIRTACHRACPVAARTFAPDPAPSPLDALGSAMRFTTEVVLP